MATPLGWSKAGSGSVCLAFDQLRDVIESQEELIHQLRNVVCSQRSLGRGGAGCLTDGGGARTCSDAGRWLERMAHGVIRRRLGLVGRGRAKKRRAFLNQGILTNIKPYSPFRLPGYCKSW